jgi:uncharacterized protein
VIIGILSDTHDRDDAMTAGLRILRDRRAEFFAHCGDIGTQTCIDLLAGLPSAFVFGNTDWDRAGLARYAASIEVACYGNFASLELAGKKLAIMHGDDLRLKQQVLAAQEHDYLLLGHSHVKLDQRVGRTRVINPGALHRVAQKTVATLDTDADVLEFINVTT